MEIVCTLTIQGKKKYLRYRDVLRAVGFLLRDNYLHVYEKDDGESSVDLTDEKIEIIFAFHLENEFKLSLKNYIKNHKNNKVLPYVILEESDSELADICEKSKFKFSKVSESSESFKALFSELYNWLTDALAGAALEDKDKGLDKCLKHYLDDSAEEEDQKVKNPYYEYYFLNRRYDKLMCEAREILYKKNFEDLINQIKEKIGIYPEHTKFYILMGLIYQNQLRDYDNALDCYEKAYDLSPKNAFTAYYVGAILQRKLPKASVYKIIEFYQCSLNNSSVCYQTHFKLARLYEELGWFSQALSQYKRLMEILSYGNKKGCLTNDEYTYLWKYEYFTMNIYERFERYKEALWHVNQLIDMRQRGYLAHEPEPITGYNEKVMKILGEKKHFFSSKMAVSFA